MDLEDGILAVRIARETAEAETEGRNISASVPSSFYDKCGVFVTFKTFPDDELRGCIGYPEPYFPFIEALTRSARSACHDPRFPDLGRNEVDNVTIEVTVLTPPEPLTCAKDELKDEVIIGRDGLIIEHRGYRGLLLPQVPVEWKWNVNEFLENVSMKAGLPANAWKHADSKLWRFSGEVFSELEPNGEVVKVGG